MKPPAIIAPTSVPWLSGDRPRALDELGMPPAVLARARALALQRHGLIVVAGLPGSGRTTTARAMVRCRAVRTERIIVVHDETAADIVRGVVARDLDVVVIDRIHDRVTADLGVEAAMMGRLVIATLHAVDWLAAISCLVAFGVAEYLLAATLDGVLAQRLSPRSFELIVPGDDLRDAIALRASPATMRALAGV